VIVDDFVDLVINNPRVNYTRGGRYLLNPEVIVRTKKATLAFLSGSIGGPSPYHGMGIREIHQGMQITDSEFDAAVEDFRAALQQNAVAPPVVTIAMAAVESVRGQIVEQKSSAS
jgi:hemoglobin